MPGPTHDPNARLTPAQMQTMTELMDIGGPRPTTPPGLVAELTEIIATGTREALRSWPTGRLYLTKGQLFTTLRCEGQMAAAADAGPLQGPSLQMVAGTLAHRATQLAYTHPGFDPSRYVTEAMAALVDDDATFAEFVRTQGMAASSDLVNEATSKVVSFLDSWPPLHAAWTPQFEVKTQAKVGKLTLSARIDLTLGRPRPDMRASMLLADLKTGSIDEERHRDEAMFYALVATLRHGCMPFRSTVFSLASGAWTDPDVTAEGLLQAAGMVVRGVTAQLEVLSGHRLPVLTPGSHCRFCVQRDDCPSAALAAARSPMMSGTAEAPPAPGLPTGSSQAA